VDAEPTEERDPETWHHGLVATWWAEFNDDFRPHEIGYFQTHIARGGEPALDVACGTGRVLIPCLRAGLDVDGCDVSTDMIERCREKAAREGLATHLSVQPLHALEPTRRYRTIVVCGAFGLGSTHAQDIRALQRLRELLEPDGTLLLDSEVPYADERLWRSWIADARASLPESPKPIGDRRLASDGAEYALGSRLLAVDPLAQRVTYGIHAERWRDGVLELEEDGVLDVNVYFPNELRAMLERAGFVNVVVEGDHNGLPATSEDEFVVFVARRGDRAESS
jgi:SAM-dependent methyltransferase